MNSDDFFEEQLPSSKIKTSIVTEYFFGWYKIMLKWSNKIGYIDFFSGRGKYADGADSTPLIIIKRAIEDSKLSAALVTIFNDKDKSNIQQLEEAVDKIPGIKTLVHKPYYENMSIGSEIIKLMHEIEMIPSLIFIDPWGYKGLSLELIGSVIKDWGCDCIFFFNYNRINAAITNPFMVENINSIFGEVIADELREKVSGLTPEQREILILKSFFKGLKTVKGQYSIPFKFFQEDGSKTSHFIILVTKNILGYHLMKEIMARNCADEDGIPTFEFNPKIVNKPKQVNLFTGIVGPFIDFCNDLIKHFKGRTLSVEEVYEEHNLNKPYIKSNYKNALLKLEEENKIIASPPADKRRKIKGKLTMGDNVLITFK